MKHPSWLNAITLALVLGGCANPPAGSSDATLLHRIDTVMRQASPTMTVGLKLSATEVKTGDAITTEVSSGTAGFVYLFQMGTEGQTLNLIFPNAMDGANYIAAGTSLGLPRPGWRMSARGPAGVGHILAVVTDKPLDLLALQSATRQGQLDVRSPFGAAMATLRETAP